MSGARPMLRVGLTGGIASGKTTVAHILAELGAFVIEGDQLAHEVIAAGGSAYDAVVARFGERILDEKARVVRSRLAEIVFHDRTAREALNAIVHPAIRDEVERLIDEYTTRGHAPVAVFDAALLVETGRYKDFHRLVVVRCSREGQIRRLLVRDGLDAAEARARISAQAPIEDKLALADYVIDTEGTLRETRRQTEALYPDLLQDFEKEFGAPGV